MRLQLRPLPARWVLSAAGDMRYFTAQHGGGNKAVAT